MAPADVSVHHFSDGSDVKPSLTRSVVVSSDVPGEYQQGSGRGGVKVSNVVSWSLDPCSQPPSSVAAGDQFVGVHKRHLSTQLFRAAFKGNLSQVVAILRLGVNANTTNDRGQNLLMAAIFIPDDAKRRRIVDYLIHEANVDCKTVDKTTGRDVLGWAAYLGRHEEVSVPSSSCMFV